ncbi:MAG TPA: VOC family protein [Pilimelia sp.]|nr:VOC family protein [Pilimelia sp.]
MIGTLRNVVLDARDIAGLSAFYTGFAGWRQEYADDEWVTLRTVDGWRIGLQAAPAHVPPRWSDPARPPQGHLDLRVPDLDAASARAVELGAVRLRTTGTRHTLADPAGHPFDLCGMPGDPRTTLAGVTLDCPDPTALSAFYAELLGGPVSHAADGLATVGTEGGRPVRFQRVAAYTPPRWLDPAAPQQLHLCIAVADIGAAEPAALAVGASPLPGDGENWRVYADPAGKPFCLVWGVA